MRWRIFLLSLILALPRLTPAATQNRFIVRSTLGLQALTQLCTLPTLGCSVVGGLDGSLTQLFLLTTPVDPTVFLTTLRATPGIVAAEPDQLFSMVGGLNKVVAPLPSGLSDTTLVTYYGSSVWRGYVNQPAAAKVQVANAQNTYSVTGAGIVADIDTGVDPNHPAFAGVLLQGYDFTRNQPGASEINDLTPMDFPVFPPTACSGSTCPQPAIVNQQSAAILDQQSAAILDTNPKYAAFGHGTMVMGVIHLVAPQAKLLPLKAFSSDGNGYLSDILRAIYYAVQNNAKIVNMSFEFKVSSPDSELQNAINYANQLGIVCSASVGNDAQLNPSVYPASFTSAVMGVASTSDLDTRSSFSNYGNSLVFVAAPGEAIITTYPFSTYSAGWGTSFSAPFVSGGASLLVNKQPSITHSLAAGAIAHADVVGPDLGHGRLNLVLALGSLAPAPPPDFDTLAAPSDASIAAGQSASYSASVTPIGGFKGTVTLSCGGAPAASTCSISPSQVTLGGNDPVIATVTVATTARSFLPPMGPGRFVPPLPLRELLAEFLAYLLVCTMLWRLARFPRKRVFATAALVLPIALLCSSCGSGSSSSSTNPPPPQHGTPQGGFTITVTGTSANLSHSANVKLTVN